MTGLHATVQVSGYEIPLIGIRPDAMLETCDLCGDYFNIRQVQISDNGRQILCEKCRRDEPTHRI
jgi:hypothetical protein